MRGSEERRKQRGCDSNVIQNVDIYGLPITLYFEKKLRYKTNFGAVMSIITGLAVFILGGYKFIEMFLYMSS